MSNTTIQTIALSVINIPMYRGVGGNDIGDKLYEEIVELPTTMKGRNNE